jgi:hypothetical protein
MQPDDQHQIPTFSPHMSRTEWHAALNQVLTGSDTSFHLESALLMGIAVLLLDIRDRLPEPDLIYAEGEDES